MDPTTCYQEMLDAMHHRDFDTARDRAIALKDWLNRGGFYPTGHDREEVHQRLAEALWNTAEQ